MKPLPRLVAVLAFLTPLASAQATKRDPLLLYPEDYRILFENEAHKQTPHLRASFEERQREGWTTEILVFQRAE